MRKTLSICFVAMFALAISFQVGCGPEPGPIKQGTAQNSDIGSSTHVEKDDEGKDLPKGLVNQK